jgi:hypothetical protein
MCVSTNERKFVEADKFYVQQSILQLAPNNTPSAKQFAS